MLQDLAYSKIRMKMAGLKAPLFICQSVKRDGSF